MIRKLLLLCLFAVGISGFTDKMTAQYSRYVGISVLGNGTSLTPSVDSGVALIHPGQLFSRTDDPMYFRSTSETPILNSSDISPLLGKMQKIRNRLFYAGSGAYSIHYGYSTGPFIYEVEDNYLVEWHTTNPMYELGPLTPFSVGTSVDGDLLVSDGDFFVSFDATRSILTRNYKGDSLAKDLHGFADLAGSSSLNFARGAKAHGPDSTLVVNYNEDIEVAFQQAVPGKFNLFFRRGDTSFLATTTHIFAQDLGLLIQIPTSLAGKSCYDAGDAGLVVQDSNNEYFRWIADSTWQSISKPGLPEYSDIVKRPEGWYVINRGIMTFDPNEPSLAPVNELTLNIQADSAVNLSVPVRNPRNGTTTYYTLTVTNPTPDTITEAEVVVYPVPNTGVLPQLVWFENIVAVDTLLPFGQQTLNGSVILYDGIINPNVQAGVTACVYTVNKNAVNDSARNSCVSSRTGQVVTTSESKSTSFFNVGPNPASTVSVVRSLVPLRRLQLISLTGLVLQTIEHPSDVETLNLSHLPAGCYFVSATTQEGRTLRQRLVKE